MEQGNRLPDVWVNPDVDPRNTDRVSANGELANCELATLQDYLSDYRLTLRMKCEGLDAEQLACRCVPPSTMSLLGLLRHLAEIKGDRRNWITPGHPLPKLYGKRDADFDGAIAEEAAVHRIEEYARSLGTPTSCEAVQINLVRDAVAQARSHISVGAALPDPGRQDGESCRRSHLDLQSVHLHVLEFDLARALVHQ